MEVCHFYVVLSTGHKKLFACNKCELLTAAYRPKPALKIEAPNDGLWHIAAGQLDLALVAFDTPEAAFAVLL
jgi:hypothetical protein